MTNNARTLGEAGSDLLTEITRQGKRIFNYADAVKAYGSSNRRLRELLSTLVKRGWLQRIEKGKISHITTRKLDGNENGPNMNLSLLPTLLSHIILDFAVH